MRNRMYLKWYPEITARRTPTKKVFFFFFLWFCVCQAPTQNKSPLQVTHSSSSSSHNKAYHCRTFIKNNNNNKLRSHPPNLIPNAISLLQGLNLLHVKQEWASVVKKKSIFLQLRLRLFPTSCYQLPLQKVLKARNSRECGQKCHMNKAVDSSSYQLLTAVSILVNQGTFLKKFIQGYIRFNDVSRNEVLNQQNTLHC